MSIDATNGEWTWSVDQVGEQALPFTITLEDGTHPDVTGWTWQATVATAPVDDGGVTVAAATVTDLDTDGNGVLRVADADAVNLQTGMWVELVQLTPTKQAWLRATLAANERVHV